MEGTARDVRIVVVGDEPCGRRGLTLRLNAEPGLVVVGEAADGNEAAALAVARRADIVLADVRRRGAEGLAASGRVAAGVPAIPVVVLSLFDDAVSRAEAARAGASAFVSKHDPDAALLDAVRASMPPPG